MEGNAPLDVYNPDKKSRGEKLVLALSGSMDSLVSAYLMKIQKYDLVAVTVLNPWDAYDGDQSKVFSCHLSEEKIQFLKDFSRKLGIPHHIVRASSEMKDQVIDPWLGDKILGRYPKPCWDCHSLRMSMVYQKMRELGIKHMATGHYAKIFRNDGHHTVFVHSSNDEFHDQSSLLSRLPHDVLDSLILPLSDLTKKEVLKLAENFGVEESRKEIGIHGCLEGGAGVRAQIEKSVPKSFQKGGEIVTADGRMNLGQHKGVHCHTLGGPFEVLDGVRPVKGVLGEYVYLEKKMVTVEEDFFLKDRCLLTRCRFAEEQAWPEPVKAFASFGIGELIECWVHPKTLSAVFIEFESPHRLVEGQMVTIFKKKGKNSKVYISGEVQKMSERTVLKEGEENDSEISPTLMY